MELLLEAEVVEAIGDEPVPPAEVVTYQEHGAVYSIGAAVELNTVKMPFQANPRVEAEETDKEGNMSGLYYHFGLLTGTREPGGLRYRSGITGRPPSSAGLNR